MANPVIKSTMEERQELLLRLKDAYHHNPQASELKTAIMIVEDLINVCDVLSNTKNAILTQSCEVNGKQSLRFVYPPTLQSIGTYEWDGSHQDLGLLVLGMIQ